MKPLTEQDICPLWDENRPPHFWCDWTHFTGTNKKHTLQFVNAVLAKFGGLSEGEVRERERAAWNNLASYAVCVSDKAECDLRRDRLYPSVPPQPRTVTLSTGVFTYTKAAGWYGSLGGYPNGPHCHTADDFEQCAKVMRESEK